MIINYVSVGVRMSYADGDVQWMRAGRGVIHEEMWDLRESDWAHKKIEIFQLWVNLPSKSKSRKRSNVRCTALASSVSFLSF